MDKPEYCGASAARSSDVLPKKDVKLQSLQCPSKSRINAERLKLEEDLNNLMKIIREKEASLKERANDYDENQLRLKEIRQNKDATINQRKSIDDDLRMLNDGKNREAFMKLRGSLQYRTEGALNEAIRRLELQLATHNFRVLEEKKIVQEIDRLKRSKKILHEYLALEQEQERMKSKQRMMRNQRDTLYRCVTSLKNDEDDMKRALTENRNLIDQLKKDLDGLHAQRRKLCTDLQQASQPLLQELQLNSQLNYRKRETIHQQHIPKDETKALKERTVARKKDRNDCKFVGDVLREKEMLCNTLITYLQRLAISPAVTPTTPVSEAPSILDTPVQEVQQDDTILLVLKKKGSGADACQRSNRSSRKGKRDRKRVLQNRLLIHTPDMLEQFYKLEINPPSSLNDAAACLEALSTRKQQLIYMRENAPSAVEQSSTSERVCGEYTNKNVWKNDHFCQLAVNTSEDGIGKAMIKKAGAHSSDIVTSECDQRIGMMENLISAELNCVDCTGVIQLPHYGSADASAACDSIPAIANGFLPICDDTSTANGSVKPEITRHLKVANELHHRALAQVCDTDPCDKYILLNSNGDQSGGYVTRLSNGSVIPEDEVEETVCKMQMPTKAHLTDSKVPGVISMDCSLKHLCKVQVDIS